MKIVSGLFLFTILSMNIHENSTQIILKMCYEQRNGL